MDTNRDKKNISVSVSKVKKEVFSDNRHIKPGAVAAICLIALVVIVLLFTVFPKKNITGVWRMNEGCFTIKSTEYYDHFAIEFRDNGEYILYSGPEYTEEYNRGSYMFDNKKITLVVDGYFHFQYNYTLRGNQLSMVSSRGTSSYTKVNLNAAPEPFDDSQITREYESQGYEIRDTKLVSKSTDERVYHITMAQSYEYMDEVVVREDRYQYSRVGQLWYLDQSSDYEVSEDWQRILGVWEWSNIYGSYQKLSIYSFDGAEASIDYQNNFIMSGGLKYTGTVSVSQYGNARGEYYIVIRNGSNWTDAVIKKDIGVEEYTYQGAIPN